MDPDSKLIRGCLRGRTSSQKMLYDKFKHALFMLCLRYASTREDAEDYLQESFIAIFRDLHQYNPEKGKLITWMRRVTINVALQDIRRKKLKFTELNEQYAESTFSEFKPDSPLHLEDIMQCVRMLPDGYRTIFNLYEIEGYSHAEIAEMLDISVATSRSQLFKAKRALKEFLVHATQTENLNHVRE